MVFLLLNDQEELLASGDPKYAHLKEPLHLQVENDVDADFSSTITSNSNYNENDDTDGIHQISALASPAEAHLRIATALTEVRDI